MNKKNGKEEEPFELPDEEKEIFLGFVNYQDFGDVGLDDRNLNIDGCARFLYITCKANQASKVTDDDYKEKVWLNLLIVDPYNKMPQVAHFKSKKIFDLRTTSQYEDVIK